MRMLSPGSWLRLLAVMIPTLVSCGGGSGTGYTAAQVLAAAQGRMIAGNKVNSQPHLNTMTQKLTTNVYEVAPGVFSYTSSMAIDTDGSDPDPDPDHQDRTAWEDSNGAALGAHHVPYFVLADECPDGVSPCKWFYYKDRNIKGLQFALMFYDGKVIGAVFGDTQGPPGGDARELGEASVKAADLLGIPSSGTTGGVDDGVTVIVFSGTRWVLSGTNGDLNDKAQVLVQEAIDTLGGQLGL